MSSGSETETPLTWVNYLTDWGRPIVATVVLVMCAPGEHYLARLAGWYDWLAWGMPAVLTAYAGISAVVATKRPKGEHGKATAVSGAAASILLAMAAQPVAHLLALPGTWDTRHTVTLVVSCIPPLVLGHLLHLAASQRRKDKVVTQDVRDVEADTVPMSLVWDKPWTDNGTQGRLSDTEFSSQPVLSGTPGQDTDTELETLFASPSAVVPARVPPRPVVRSLVSGSVPSVVRDALGDNPGASDADLRDIILNRVGPDTKPDTIRKAIYRARNVS